MELLQDGVVAALAAIGVTALIWLAASLLLWRERPVDAVYLVRGCGYWRRTGGCRCCWWTAD